MTSSKKNNVFQDIKSFDATLEPWQAEKAAGESAQYTCMQLSLKCKYFKCHHIVQMTLLVSNSVATHIVGKKNLQVILH